MTRREEGVGDCRTFGVEELKKNGEGPPKDDYVWVTEHC